MRHVEVERMQYGVGQGCFHGQEIHVGLIGQPPEKTVRFVYDCGSSSKEKGLKWPVSQFTNGDADYPINALYLSHFENDHVNGVALLSQKAKIGRIYVPYLNKDLATHIIARAVAAAVAAGNSSAVKEAVVNVSEIVSEIVSSGTIHGQPVIMVQSDGEEPPLADLEDTRPQDPTNDSIMDEVIVEMPGQSETKGATIYHRETAHISIASPAIGARTKVWEIVTWCYSCDPQLTDAVVIQVSKIAGALTHFFPCMTLGSKAVDRQKALRWIKDNFTAIAKHYKSAINSYNAVRKLSGKPLIADDHNVTSLCVYSGPTFELDYSGTYRSNRMAWPGYGYRCCFPGTPGGNASWLATGDALLEDFDVWRDFEDHFGRERLSRCCTVLIPHHGSGKGGNFNQELVDDERICVISAGASNAYRHPGRSVVRGIFGGGGHPVIVTEAEPIGFVEYLRIPLGV